LVPKKVADGVEYLGDFLDDGLFGFDVVAVDVDGDFAVGAHRLDEPTDLPNGGMLDPLRYRQSLENDS